MSLCVWGVGEGRPCAQAQDADAADEADDGRCSMQSIQECVFGFGTRVCIYVCVGLWLFLWRAESVKRTGGRELYSCDEN